MNDLQMMADLNFLITLNLDKAWNITRTSLNFYSLLRRINSKEFRLKNIRVEVDGGKKRRKVYQKKFLLLMFLRKRNFERVFDKEVQGTSWNDEVGNLWYEKVSRKKLKHAKTRKKFFLPHTTSFPRSLSALLIPSDLDCWPIFLFLNRCTCCVSDFHPRFCGRDATFPFHWKRANSICGSTSLDVINWIENKTWFSGADEYTNEMIKNCLHIFMSLAR